MRFNNYFMDAFLEEKQYWQGLTKASLSAYKTALRHLQNYELIELDDPTTFTAQNFRRLLFDLSTRNNWSSHTYNRLRKDYRVFCWYLVRENYITTNPIDQIVRKKIPKELPKHFTKDQIDKILWLLHSMYPKDDIIDTRNKTIVYTYLYTGLRLYELINLRPEDVNHSEGYIRVQSGKWEKDRIVPILEKLQPILRSFESLRNRTFADPKAYFPTYIWGKLQHREIYNVLYRIKKKVTFKITTHMFRHTFATELAKKDLNLYNISQILGHSNLNTTKIYLNFQVDAIRTKINSLDLYT